MAADLLPGVMSTQASFRMWWVGGRWLEREMTRGSLCKKRYFTHLQCPDFFFFFFCCFYPPQYAVWLECVPTPLPIKVSFKSVGNFLVMMVGFRNCCQNPKNMFDFSMFCSSNWYLWKITLWCSTAFEAEANKLAEYLILRHSAANVVTVLQ